MLAVPAAAVKAQRRELVVGAPSPLPVTACSPGCPGSCGKPLPSSSTGCWLPSAREEGARALTVAGRIKSTGTGLATRLSCAGRAEGVARPRVKRVESRAVTLGRAQAPAPEAGSSESSAVRCLSPGTSPVSSHSSAEARAGLGRAAAREKGRGEPGVSTATLGVAAGVSSVSLAYHSTVAAGEGACTAAPVAWDLRATATCR